MKHYNMSTVSLTFRLISVLSLLTIINMMFFGMSWKGRNIRVTCSSDAILLGVAKYIQENGQSSIEQELIEPCKNPGPSQDSKDLLMNAMQTVIQECNYRKMQPRRKTKFTNPIITLFTSWSASTDRDKDTVHNNTLRNWSMFGPKVKCFLFTNDSSVVKAAGRYGIESMPISHHGGGGAPVLKSMFVTVKKVFPKSHLYAFVNSDILFTDKFIDSLEFVLSNIDSDDLKRPLFMTGQRTNVDNVSPEDATDSSTLEDLAKARGILFTNNAEDYFITNHAFPWENIADVVIGRLAYDNWLVGHARCNINATVIDLSGTVLAVHQTTKSGGNFEGFKHSQAHYNEALLKNKSIVPVYERGFTDCAETLTHYTLCGDMKLSRRNQIASQCSCPSQKQSTKQTVVTVF